MKKPKRKLKVIKLKGHEFYKKKKIRAGLIDQLKVIVKDSNKNVPKPLRVTVTKLINLAVIDYINDYHKTTKKK